MKGQICQNTIQRGMLTIIVLKYMETMECTSLMLHSYCFISIFHYQKSNTVFLNVKCKIDLIF